MFLFFAGSILNDVCIRNARPLALAQAPEQSGIIFGCHLIVYVNDKELSWRFGSTRPSLASRKFLPKQILLSTSTKIIFCISISLARRLVLARHPSSSIFVADRSVPGDRSRLKFNSISRRRNHDELSSFNSCYRAKNKKTANFICSQYH